eukprot:TRINITY_DN1852_c0_g1_i28.p1 TRINITY_DN1852_c0_g1~~TRINITY_DN1852_c0_g1_i28.p1  ORF type:complete len:152 (+),score=21.57 TRINITY_DN1852_c0_g1_i28:721-1176(+)
MNGSGLSCFTLLSQGESKKAWHILNLGHLAGDPACSFYLSNHLRETDPQGSFEALKKSADGGFLLAQHNLGVAYLEGTMCDPDPKLAAEYFRKSASKEYVPSILNMAHLYRDGIGTEKDLETAKIFYLKVLDSEANDQMKTIADKYAKLLS